MTNTFLKRRGGGGGCWRGEGSGLWTFSSAEHQDSVQHGLSIHHDSSWITFMHAHRSTRAHTHMLWRHHGWCTGCSMVCVCVCDVSAGLNRGQSCQRGRPQPRQSAHEKDTQLCCGPFGVQLLRSDGCNDNSLGRRCPTKNRKKESWQFNKNANPHYFEVETAQKSWIVILQCLNKDMKKKQNYSMSCRHASCVGTAQAGLVKQCESLDLSH